MSVTLFEIILLTVSEITLFNVIVKTWKIQRKPTKELRYIKRQQNRMNGKIGYDGGSVRANCVDKGHGWYGVNWIGKGVTGRSGRRQGVKDLS